jgi:hypothetical protein
VYPADAVFGSHEGRTQAGARVFNVALPLLWSRYPHRPPIKIFELAGQAQPQPGSLGQVPV